MNTKNLQTRLREGAEQEALQTLKDHSINVQDFIRKALIKKAEELE